MKLAEKVGTPAMELKKAAPLGTAFATYVSYVVPGPLNPPPSRT
jgi:hypothetical protein